MKVLQINTVCGSGSTGRIATDLYGALVGEGHECCIAYGRGQAPVGYNTIKIGSDIDVYYHALMNRITDRHGLYSTNATKDFIKKAETYNPDVIHLHNIHGYYINIEILFKYLKKANKPVVWTMHDCWSFTGHCAHFEYIGCDRWLTACHDCPQKSTYPASNLMDNSKDNYLLKKELFTSLGEMTIVTPSKWLSELVKRSFLNKYPVQVINNGIDLNVFKPTDSNFRERYNLQDKFIILGVANVWTERKGLNDFIKLAGLIDNDKQAIVLVGLNNKQFKNIPTNIIGIKRTHSVQELAAIYSAADVFFNPTYEDNYPTVNLESIACGTPVVTYDTGGSGESVIYPTYGFVIKHNDLHNIANLNLVEFSKLYPLIKPKQFDKNKMVAHYIATLQNTNASSRGSII